MELIQHFSHKKHPLMFVEEFKNDGEIEVIFVCSGCDKSICGPAYKCSHCNFFLHKSCAQLPPEIQHPVHPNHSLLLQIPSDLNNRNCDLCLKDCERCFFYHCNSCDFDIDIKCASSWRTNTDNGHQHEFFPILQQIQFTCELCGEDFNSIAQVCRICQLLAHSLCTWRPRSIKIITDRHMLTLIHLLGKVIKDNHDPVFCNLCYKKVNLNYAAYYCQQCNFVAHLNCAGDISIRLPSDTINSSIEEEEGILFKEAEEGEELQHFAHEHKLIISRNEVEVHDHKLCEGCMQSIIYAPFYSCDQCNYFLHSTCARLPLMKRHPIHRHKLTLSASGKYINGLKFCGSCRRDSHGFTYKCHECDIELDIRCCSIPIKSFKHKGHQHSLFLATYSDKKCNIKCNACDRSEIYGGLFVCIKCNFALCFTCATLPLKAKYEYDLHPLSLTSTAENDSEECYCLICEEERSPNHWFYYCAECNFVAHPHCVVGRSPYIKYGKAFTHSNHQHPLSLVRRTKVSRPCDACSETFDQGVAINCTQCKSTIHWWSRCFDKLFKNKITS